ncbi:MAG: AMP-binding protein [Mogibacterium sp.]|nr:AMP-binding protein [Mogibacterium sp.]
MVRYSDFKELIRSFRHRSGAALEFAEEGGEISRIFYPELAERILNRSRELEGFPAVRILPAEQTPETVIDIFAEVIAGHDLILCDPMLETDWAEAAAEKCLAARRQQELEAGWARGEGELLFATSGTTSRSKVVRLTSRSLCASAWSGQSMLPCGEEDRLLSVLPLSHVFGFVCSMLWGLAYGATVALGRGLRHLMEDARFFRPTILPAVPSLIAAMVRFEVLNPELRIVLIGAAPCPEEVTEALQAAGIRVYLGYGLTETSSGIAITQDQEEPEALYPCPGADIRIEADGEVSVATPCMMEGYLGLAPMAAGRRFFTGDLGSFDEKGRLHLVGRKKDVLILPDGTKIYCPEYEATLGAEVGSAELAVILRDGHAALVAGGDVDAGMLRDAVNELNRGKLRSQQIYEILTAEEPLPRTATGKLKRYEIQERYNQEAQ